MVKISDLSPLTTPADADELVIVDKSDTTQSADGSTKKITYANLTASLAGGGGVDTSGTPVANDFARFTDADTIEGRSYAEVRADLSLEVGTDVQAWSAVLDATTASFTTADESKLDGIEAGADVTDTANVTAAGALMDSEVDADIKTLTLPANTTISTFGASLVDDADAAAARTTLGLGSAATSASTAFVAKKSATTQSGTTYTVDADDDETTVRLTNASAVTVTIPTGLTVGYRVVLFAEGAGGVSLTTTGNTLAGSSPSTGCAQNEALYVEVVASNTLIVLGGTA